MVRSKMESRVWNCDRRRDLPRSRVSGEGVLGSDSIESDIVDTGAGELEREVVENGGNGGKVVAVMVVVDGVEATTWVRWKWSNMRVRIESNFFTISWIF